MSADSCENANEKHGCVPDCTERDTLPSRGRCGLRNRSAIDCLKHTIKISKVGKDHICSNRAKAISPLTRGDADKGDAKIGSSSHIPYAIADGDNTVEPRCFVVGSGTAECHFDDLLA